MITSLKDRIKKREFWLNRFSIAFILFIVWMSFFDKSRWPVQWKLNDVIENLEAEKMDYEEKIVQAKADKIDLESNLEKYAREKYYMHKEGEEIFIIEKRKK